jgi:membrane protease YdiL (CAAX protease family)
LARPYQYRPVLFFVATFVATWIPWFIGAYLATDQRGQSSVSPFGYVGLLGPLVVSLAFILTSGSKALKADFRSRFNPRRLRPFYVIVAIAIPTVLMYLGILVSLPFGESADQFRVSRDANLVGMIILAMILAPIIEEISWRGYGVDSLRAKLGGLASTVLFGVLWSAWHLPLVLLPGTYQHEVATTGEPLFLANFFVSAIPAAILANWLYYRNGRSILIGVLFHAAANAAAEALSATQVTKCIVTVLWLVVAVVVLVFDRTTFAAGPRTFVEDPGDDAAGEPAMGATAVMTP